MAAAVVLVHGYSGSPRDLEPIADSLRSVCDEKAVRVALLPGHDAGPPPHFDERAFKRSLSDAITSACIEGTKLILIGHSTGGTLLVSLLAERNIVPALLVLIAAPKRIDVSYLERWTSHRTGKSSIAFGDLACAISFINRTGEGRISGSFPVLAVHGTEDDLVPVADAAAWEQGTFEGPVRIVRIPGAGHHLFTGAGSSMAIDVILGAVRETLSSQEGSDDDIASSITAVEPEARDFLDYSPASSRHLSGSPSGLAAGGRKPILAECAAIEPVFANVEITTRCNLSCSYCARAFRTVQGEDMPLERFRQVLALLPHAYRLTLVGLGEPLLHPRLTALIAAAAADKRRVGLVTNAMLLDDAAGKALLDAGLSSIAFSIDAADPSTAQKLRPGTDLDRVVRNIRSFTARARALNRPVSTAVFTAVSTGNIGSIDAVVDLASTLGVHVMMMTDLNFAENLSGSLWKNGGGDARARIRQAVTRAFSKKMPVLSVHGLEEFGLWKRYDKFLLLPPDQLFQRSVRRTWCCSPWQTIPVNVRGEVTLCDCQPDVSAGSLLEKPLPEIWNSAIFTRHRERMLSDDPPEACRVCPRF